MKLVNLGMQVALQAKEAASRHWEEEDSFKALTEYQGN